MRLEGWDCHVHVFDGKAPARAGHYVPPRRTLAMLSLAAGPIGVRHFVVVQPSVYGCDNRVLLDALREGRGLHRGVVVVDDSISGASLAAMHRLGVRGVRCNLVSPVGNSPAGLARIAPFLRDMGWHVEWYAPAEHLADIAEFQEKHRLPCVIDHLAGLNSVAAADAAEVALRRIADGGGWLKLSGWYRLEATAPYAELDPLIRRAADVFGERCVWGSDWPHTMFIERGAGATSPDYVQTWQPVSRALGAEHADRVLCLQPALLYA